MRITRAEALAAQLLQQLDARLGKVTDPRVARLAAAGRAAGVVLHPAPRR